MQIPKDTVTNYPGNKKHAVTTCSHSLSRISVINLLFCDLLVSPRARESKTVLDSVFHAVDSGFQLLDPSLSQWNLESGFQSLVGFGIPDSLSCIPDSKVQDSGFHKQKFPGFQNSDSLTVPFWNTLHYRNIFCWISLHMFTFNFYKSNLTPCKV